MAETVLDWKPLTSEVSRTYEFPSGKCVTINAPVRLAVSASGGHRVLDAANIGHYIPTGWEHLWWITKDGQEPFEF